MTTSKDIYTRHLEAHPIGFQPGVARSKYFLVFLQGDLEHGKLTVRSLPCNYMLAFENESCLYILVQLSSRKRISFIQRHLTRQKVDEERRPTLTMDHHIVSLQNPGQAYDVMQLLLQLNDDAWTWEFGNFSTPNQIMGASRKKAADDGKKILEAVDAMKVLSSHCDNKAQAYMACSEEHGESMHHFDRVWKYEMYRKEEEVQERLRLRAVSQDLRPWQVYLEKRLQNFQTEENCDRKVIVVLDEEGGAGKSFFIRHYMHKYPYTSVNVSQGKSNDMMNIIYNSSSVIDVLFLDLTRFQRDNVNLSVVETVKNGMIQNHKYGTGHKTLEQSPAWVIMTNSPLDWEKMSTDRWNIIQPQKDGSWKVSNYEEYARDNPLPAAAPNYIAVANPHGLQ